MILAAVNADDDIVKMLIELGADANQKNKVSDLPI